MSIIRFRYKADKNFESVKIDGMSCSLGELKRLIAAKSTRPGPQQSRNDYDLIISNANTHEEYKDNSDLIPRNASVVVARRIRGTSEALTPFSNQKPVVSSDDIVTDFLRPAILNQRQDATLSMPPVIVEPKLTPLERLAESMSSTATAKEMTEDEMIKEIQMGSQARYVTPHPNHQYRQNLFVCHNCKQPGHIKNQCPLLLQSSNSTGNNSNSASVSTGDHLFRSDGGSSGSSGPTRSSMPQSSHIVTRHAPYQLPYHHRGGRMHHRGSGHPRGEPAPKKTTGIPRDRLIPVPKHIPGAFKDQTGASVVPLQLAELYVERIEKKTDALAQQAKQADGKSLVPATATSSKSADDDPPPDDLLCPLCKQVYRDAVITPCCNFSFCDECIRNALIESTELKCPHCQRQYVAVDQINPNLFLRNHVTRWRERQNHVSYSHGPSTQLASQKLDQDSDITSKQSSESTPDHLDEYDIAVLPTHSDHFASAAAVKTAPIVIKMQPHGRSQSPPPATSTPSMDKSPEDDKESDSEHGTLSQKDNAEADNGFGGESANPKADKLSSFMFTEHERQDSETPPSQQAPVNIMYNSSSSPTTNLGGTNPMVPHYYQPAPLPLPPPAQHNVLFPHHIPPAGSNGLYPMQPNYYPNPMGMRYAAPGVHHYPGYAPGPPVHHPLSVPHPPPPHHHPHHHPMIAAPHAPLNPINGYNVPAFHPHTNAPFASTSTSTFITHHHQTATQPISTALTTALSEDEFYLKQRYFQRYQRSPSRRRSRSRSSSFSSYSSSDSRSSSRSRHDRRPRRRSSRSRSRSRRRVDTRRVKSPIRDDRRLRRSSSYRNRRAPVSTRDNHSSKYRRSPPRRSRDRDRERPRSPRPPPTVQQSTQRTIVYMQESSHLGRDRDRDRPPRSKDHSHGADDRPSSSSKPEQQPPSESIVSTSSPPPVAPPTLSSTIETVVQHTSDQATKEEKPKEVTPTKNGKKHKKHHKKHRRHGSKSKKRHRSKDKEKKTIVDTSTTVIQIQS